MAQETLSRIPVKRYTTQHILVKLAKDKDYEGILKTAREKQLATCMGSLIRLKPDFSSKTLEARRQCND